MPEDKWGIPYIYSTKKTAGLSGKSTGFFWQQNNDFRKDVDAGFLRLGKETDACKLINSSTGEWEFPFTFAYDYSAGLALSGPTGHHTGGESHGCQGFTYMIDSANLDGSNPTFRFRKETYHVQYNTDPKTGEDWSSPSATGTVANNWKGYCWVRYNKKDGRGPGKDSVICEVWWNNSPTADIKKWVMLKRTEDLGAGKSNWGVKATCDGADYQVGTWSNIQFRIKSSGSDFSLHPLIPETNEGQNIDSIGGEDMSFSDCESRGYGKRIDMPRDIEMKLLVKWNAGGQGKAHFKNMSLREIDPSISFDDNPTTPDEPDQPTTTTTISGTFRFSQDINIMRASPCAGIGVTGGGGGGAPDTSGGTVFYDRGNADDHTTELSDTSTFQNRTRGGEQCENSSSPMRGKILKQLYVVLAKVGSPSASPTVRAKIWTSGGSVRYTSPTSVDPSTLPTSLSTSTKTFFDFAANTISINTGDIVGVEWTGTSSSNYVIFGYGDKTISNCVYIQYENGSWETKATTRDFGADMWE